MRQKSYLIAGCVITLLGTLKIYPFVGIFIPFFALTNWSKRLWILFASLFGVLIISDELSLISDRSVTTWNSISYGMNVIPLIIFQKFNIRDSREMSAILGFFLFVVLSIVLWKLFKRKIYEIAETISHSESYCLDFQLFGFVFVFSYLVGTSYDYRLVISFPLFMILFSLSLSIRAKVLLASLMIGIMYGGHVLNRLDSLGILLNTVSDGLILISVSLLLVILVRMNVSRIVGKII